MTTGHDPRRVAQHRCVRRRRRGRQRSLVLLAPIALAGTLATACGIPADSGFQENGELRVGPEPTTTAVPTTTTTTPQMTAPVSPPPTFGTSPPTAPPTSASEDPVGLTEPVTLYFVGGPPQDETLSESTRALSYPAQLQSVLSALIEGPPELESPGLRTLIDDDLVQGLTVDHGVLTIDLNSEAFFDLGETTTQRSAIGQLVLTFGRRPGVGQVRFTQDGERHPVQVPLDDGRWQSRNDPVSADDFSQMLAETQLTPDPDTTTTEPDADADDDDTGGTGAEDRDGEGVEDGNSTGSDAGG